MLFLSRPGTKPGLFFLVFLSAFTALSIKAEQIDINTASLEELDKITGIGPVIGQRIIDARPFTSLDDLIRVKGIGEKTLQKIREQGLAWVSQETQAEAKKETVPETESRQIQENYSSDIVINEMLPSPEGQDEKEEWIEIFNQNDFDADVSFWQITDSIGQTNTYTFPANTVIGAKGFLVFDRPTTKITLNNSQDGLLLIQPNGNIVDNVNYEKALQGQSYNRTADNWVWSNSLTPGQANTVSLPANQSEDSQETVEEQFEGKQLAAIGQQALKTSPFVLLIALSCALIFGAIIILIKKKLT